MKLKDPPPSVSRNLHSQGVTTFYWGDHGGIAKATLTEATRLN